MATPWRCRPVRGGLAGSEVGLGFGLYLGLERACPNGDDSGPVVVVGADRAHSPHVRHLDRVAVARRVQLAVPTLAGLGVETRAVLTDHTRCVVLALAIAVAAQPQVTFSDGAFTIVDGEDRHTVPLSAADPPRPFRGDRLNLRIGETLVTFDQRGLGIQYSGKGGFTTLAYMTTSPKVFSAEEIKRNAELAASGERPARLSAVSGFEVVNDRLFLLLRWDDKSGEPWLETLVDVDTSGEAPKINLLGRFGGFSFTDGAVSDELYSSGSKLFVLVRGLDGLAIGTCDTEKGTTAYKKLAPIVDEVHRFGALFYTVTNAPHGMKSIGVVNPVPERFRTVMETRGTIVPTALGASLVVNEGGRWSLYSVMTGAKIPVEEGAGLAQTPVGVLVWTPRAKPDRAVLREPGTWAVLAEWKR